MIHAAVFDPGQARVFHAPRFFREVRRIGREAGLRVDLPVRHAVVAAGHGQMRMAAAVFDADQQDRFIAQLTRAGIEHRVGRIGPVAGREDRIVRMAMEQLRVQIEGFSILEACSFPWKRGFRSAIVCVSGAWRPCRASQCRPSDCWASIVAAIPSTG